MFNKRVKSKKEKISDLVDMALIEVEARLQEYGPTDLNKLISMLLSADVKEEEESAPETPKSKANLFLEKNLKETNLYTKK
jgi:hypothetical protein